MFPGFTHLFHDAIKNKILLYRLLDSENISQKMTTDYETNLYLFTVSQSMSLHPVWFNIYRYLNSKFSNSQISRKSKYRLNKHEYGNLIELKTWLFKQQTIHSLGLH